MTIVVQRGSAAVGVGDRRRVGSDNFSAGDEWFIAPDKKVTVLVTDFGGKLLSTPAPVSVPLTPAPRDSAHGEEADAGHVHEGAKVAVRPLGNVKVSPP